ncbi:hypothetical protein NPIL_198591 [Nephila pilipes]|uniref:Uncharacterized protein n=1 Tax=Nephila pilipes TaxID=299642 RepID=A0A8X6UBX1_NEPPI|nr:hypothetical protein NPIL_198591 [Nephila pilipes]
MLDSCSRPYICFLSMVAAIGQNECAKEHHRISKKEPDAPEQCVASHKLTRVIKSDIATKHVPSSPKRRKRRGKEK